MPSPGAGDQIGQLPIHLSSVNKQIITAGGRGQELHQLRGAGRRGPGQDRGEPLCSHGRIEIAEHVDRLSAQLLGSPHTQDRNQVGSRSCPRCAGRHVPKHIALLVQAQRLHERTGQGTRIPSEILGNTRQVCGCRMFHPR